MSTIEEQKKRLRATFLSRRAALSAMEHLVLDGCINTRIAALDEFVSSDTVVAYAADSCEVNVRSIIELALQQGKQVALPRYNREQKSYEPVLIRNFQQDTAPGKYGLLEPLPELPAAVLSEQSLWLVPAAAFDGQGGRLGRGGGFYDRMLESNPGKRLGVFYQCQFSSEPLPAAVHDQRLTLAVTENKVYNF